MSNAEVLHMPPAARPISQMDPNQSIKQALAIAIARQKRKLSLEADEWRSKARRLEQQLAEQRSSNLQLQQWASSVVQQASIGSEHQMPRQKPQESQQHVDGIFLPPLVLKCQEHPRSSNQPAYELLQQQMRTAAEVAACTLDTAATDMMNGKAAALSDMLLINIQMLQKLQGVDPATSSPGHTLTRQQSLFSTRSSAAVPQESISIIGSFILETLLEIPSSSLRTAYMKQCACFLAALLADSPKQHKQQQQHQHQHHRQPAHAPTQLQKSGHQSSEADSKVVAVKIVGLLQQLLQLKAPAGAVGGVREQQQEAVGTAATSMLQYFSSFPGTSLLMALAVAQQLHKHVQQLQQANAAMASMQLGSLSSQVLQMASNAMEAAAQVFETSHELLEELDEALTQLPSWVVALAGCSWTPGALQDLVAIVSAMYSSCQELQQYQPLLATAICQLSASLATRLQHLATNSDAPGMEEGNGPALRSVCGGLCMRLRDLFMPAGAGS